MARTIVVDPLTRIEGHLRVELEVDAGKVVKARSSGTSFRGFEPILAGRDPRDAPQITQRICGVCPVAHGATACEAVEDTFAITILPQGRFIRNLIQGANFVDSHLAHFYILCLPDFVAGMPTAGAWPAGKTPQAWVGAGPLDVAALAQNAVGSLGIRRKCHEVIAMLGGKVPHPTAMVPGGVTTVLGVDDLSALRDLWLAIQAFVEGPYTHDVAAMIAAFPEYVALGASRADFLAYGGLPEPNGTRLFKQGVASAGGMLGPLDTDQIRESVASSHFKANRPLHPFEGETVPDLAKTNAYSWAKSPRLSGRPCEVGPLARALVSGRYDPSFGLGVWARHNARRDESSVVSKKALEWVAGLAPGAPALAAFPEIPPTAWGYGLSEAPRGGVGHWIQIEARKVLRYMIIAPTTWNASPRDETGVAGPIERALEGVAVADPDDPIEAVRVVHSFDPCLQCAVH